MSARPLPLPPPQQAKIRKLIAATEKMSAILELIVLTVPLPPARKFGWEGLIEEANEAAAALKEDL